MTFQDKLIELLTSIDASLSGIDYSLDRMAACIPERPVEPYVSSAIRDLERKQ